VNPVTIALALLTSVVFPVTTSDSTAQALIDRGLYFYYVYDTGDAGDAFAAAAARDRHLAMAFWGEAIAAGPDLNTPMTQERFFRAKQAAEKAVAVEAGTTVGERRYIDAIALRYQGTWPDWMRDDQAYRAAMESIADIQPNDDNAPLLAAEPLLEHGGLTWDGSQPATADSRRALLLVNSVLARDPKNAMADHLCIHLYDQAPDRTPALACAQRLDDAALLPQAEHLAHMPAHYWIETGNYAKAIASSERAYTLSMQLENLAERNVDHDRYLIHDVYVGYSAAMMLGDYATARRWATRMDAAYTKPFDALTDLRFGRFAEAYANASSDPSPTGIAIRGWAALQLGRVDESREAAARLRKLGATSGYITELFLARLAEHDGHVEEAQRWIDRAAQEQGSEFSGELIPLLPASEARGGLAMRLGNDADAVTAYRSTLVAFPDDPRALFGLATALHGLGRDNEASAARAHFTAIWGNSAAPVPL
jgi:tetratricopeptide (TPR) repeat protein